METVVTKLKDLLKAKPWQKAKILSKELGLSRGAVNAALYSNDGCFTQNEASEWSITEGAIGGMPAAPITGLEKAARSGESSRLRIEGIDLVERIRRELKENPHQKASELARGLGDNRRIVNGILHSYKDIFSRDSDKQWVVNKHHRDNVRGPDTSFGKTTATSELAAQLPTLDFEEKGKPAQQLVIEARLDRNFLVLAPPGTGKTHTLIERLVHVIASAYDEVDAGQLLVLSFTRAAVGEIRERISKAIMDGAPSSLRYVQVKTFDAYATWLLNDGGYDVSAKSYDARIKMLTDKLASFDLNQFTDRISRSRYLFVDEIQDLVGMRADMVFELVKRILSRKGSVTLLGDPHQSLNDYQIGGNQTASAEFLERVQDHLAGGLERFELEESHRYETSEMKALAADAKKVLDGNSLTPAQQFEALVALIPKISVEQLVEKFQKQEIDALLCRSNGEVYQWFAWHEGQGNVCRVNAGALGRPWPSWIGAALIHYQSDVITREQFMQRAKQITDIRFSASDDVVDEFLVNEKLLRGNLLNLEEMAFRLKYLAPASKGDTAEEGLIVSTVHKAKGLEYKNVVAVQPSQKNVTDEEVRVLYVAITRAKRSISLLPTKAKPFSRWIKKKKGGHLGYTEDSVKYLQVIGLEDFDLETLFINAQGGVDTVSLEKYLLTYREESHYAIRPESCNKENDHNYALYLNSSLGPIRLCAVGEKMKVSLDAMAWGNNYGEDGATLELGDEAVYQTVVHPLQAQLLARHIGPAGILLFPLIQGFYPLSKATGA